MYIAPIPTWIILIAAIAVFLLARWQTSQPIRPEKGPRMIPWTFVAILAGFIAIAMVANLAVLAGLDVSRGRPF